MHVIDFIVNLSFDFIFILDFILSAYTSLLS